MRRLYLVGIVIVILVVAVGAYYLMQPKAPEMPTGSYTLTFTSGTTGADWFTAGGTISNLIATAMPNVVITNVPGGGVTNVLRVNSSQADLGLTYLSTLRAGLAGGTIGGVTVVEGYLTNVKAMLSFNIPSPMTIIVRSDIPASTMDELVSKKIPMKWLAFSAGTANMMNARIMLSVAFGVTFDDLKNWGGSVSLLPSAQCLQQLQDGLADGYFGTNVLGESWIQQIMLTGKFKILPLSDAALQKITALGYPQYTIKAGTYPNQNTDIKTFADQTILIVRADLPENLVYYMTKAVVEGRNTLTLAVHSFEIDPTTAGKKVQPYLHPGAERYFRDMGYLS
jgi:TRAP transporter TAXI family solute receptor